MSVKKVIELMADSDKSWEDAAENAIKQASKSVKGIQSIWVQDFSATVDSEGKLKTYRVTAKVTFKVMDD